MSMYEVKATVRKDDCPHEAWKNHPKDVFEAGSEKEALEIGLKALAESERVTVGDLEKVHIRELRVVHWCHGDGDISCTRDIDDPTMPGDNARYWMDLDKTEDEGYVSAEWAHQEESQMAKVNCKGCIAFDENKPGFEDLLETISDGLESGKIGKFFLY